MADGDKDAITAQLRDENERLKRHVAALEERIAKLERQIEEALRRGKRQAAPFSKGSPKSDPKRPGRKPGLEYGTRASRPCPRRTDRRIEVDCPL